MCSVAIVLAAGLTACTSSSDSPTSPAPTVPTPRSSAFTPVRVTVAPPPSAAWVTATRCPTEQTAKAAFGVQTRARDTNLDIGGIGCVYRIDAQASIEVTLVQSSVDALRATLQRPPAAIVRDAPELADGAIVGYTPPGGYLDQCLVAVDRAGSALVVQVSRQDKTADRQRLCTPLGPMLRLLTAR